MTNVPTLVGSTGMFGNSNHDLKVNQVDQGRSLAEVKQATVDNNLDEIVFKDQEGQRFIVYADELEVNHGKLPSANTHVELEGFGTVFVEHVNNESNEDNNFMLASIHHGVRPGGPAGRGGVDGDPATLNAVSTTVGEYSQLEIRGEAVESLWPSLPMPMPYHPMIPYNPVLPLVAEAGAFVSQKFRELMGD